MWLNEKNKKVLDRYWGIRDWSYTSCEFINLITGTSFHTWKMKQSIKVFLMKLVQHNSATQYKLIHTYAGITIEIYIYICLRKIKLETLSKRKWHQRVWRSLKLSSEIIEARWKFPVSVTWNVSLGSPDNGETWFQGFKSLKRFNDIQERDERGGVRIFGKLIFLTTNPTNSTVVSPHKDRWPFMEACARLWHFKYPPNGTRAAFPLAELPWTWFDRSFAVTRKILSSIDSYTGRHPISMIILLEKFENSIIPIVYSVYEDRHPLMSVLTWYKAKEKKFLPS